MGSNESPCVLKLGKDYYKAPGLPPDTEEIVIRAAYRALAQRYCPDHWQGAKDDAHGRASQRWRARLPPRSCLGSIDASSANERKTPPKRGRLHSYFCAENLKQVAIF